VRILKEKQENKAKLYKDVFNRKTSYVPLTIKVTADSRPYTNFEAMREPQKAIEMPKAHLNMQGVKRRIPVY
jgi:hypothetical protein